MEKKHWMIRDFPKETKERFMGLAKANGKNWKNLLANLMRAWSHKMEKEIGK